MANPKEQAEAVRRLVVDGVADNQTAFDHVVAEQKGKEIAARLNASRTTQAPKQEEKPK